MYKSPGGAGGGVPGNTHVKTGSLQHTDNYTWNTADVLGRGATAIVFFGRNKTTGDVCAVKVFHERISHHMATTRQREIGSLRTLQHANIVKLLALETETSSRSEVLVMEYCSGGSLYSMLEQPQYAYGFPETEFLLFLKHIANGMQYLRMKGYIHRDIKPGNIMRYIADDGRSLYKLTDFGAARELQDDETFTSIYGTEEYLFPRMYEQAVLRRPGPQNFDASVDIWSLGVTLYHVITGRLPFQPFGGRNNAPTMHLITSEKPEGAISGIQTTSNGQIQWGHTLPETCQLSRQLQARLVPVLAGLMELEADRMWTFERFFQSASQLTSMLPLRLFLCCSAEHCSLYVDKMDSYSLLQERIAAETDIPAGEQLILWHDTELADLVDQTAPVQNYPKSITGARLYVINRQLMESGTLRLMYVPTFPDVSRFDNLDLDCQAAKRAAGVACLLHTAIHRCLEQQKHIYKGELLFRRFLKRIVWHSEWIAPEMRTTLQEMFYRQESFSKSFNLLLQLFSTLDNSLHVEEKVLSKVGLHSGIREPVRQLAACMQDKALQEFNKKICERMDEIQKYVEVLGKRMGEQERDRLRQIHGCLEEDHCLSKAEALKQKLIANHNTMSKHKKYGDLHSHEQFIHTCEKQRQQEYGVEMSTLANDHCRKNLQIAFRASQKELINLTKHLTRTKKVEQNITSVKESLQTLSARLQQKERKCWCIVEKINDILSKVLKKSSITVPSTGEPSLEPRSNLQIEGEEGVEFRTKEFSSGSRDGSPHQKRQRTELLEKLTDELLSLKTDSDELKVLVVESSDVMRQFLTETSNLRIEGSLDSDQRRLQPDIT